MNPMDNEISSCAAKANFALQVLGDSMEPEFGNGAVIIIDPNLPALDGAYVVADLNGDVFFRQYREEGEKRYLVALKEGYPKLLINETYRLRGVVVQQARSRRRGLPKARHYATDGSRVDSPAATAAPVGGGGYPAV